MSNIYNNILDLKNYFDVFIFDAYGVFWDGGYFYKNSIENMSILIKEYNKTVYILSNTTQTSKEAEESYNKKGLKKGIHYNEIITSGEVMKDALINNSVLKQKGIKIWQYGTSTNLVLENTNYIKTNNIDEADYIYLSSLLITNDKYKKLLNKFDKSVFFESKRTTKNGEKLWDTTDKRVFLEDIDYLYSKHLPIMVSNTDEIASAIDKNTGQTHFMIRQGTLIKELKKMGAEIIEFGKPNIIAFNFVFNKLKQNNINIDKNRTAMIGDTLKTDILGANNANIKSVLCINTGTTNYNASKIINKKININLFDAIKILEKENNVKVDYYINSVGGFN